MKDSKQHEDIEKMNLMNLAMAEAAAIESALDKLVFIGEILFAYKSEIDKWERSKDMKLEDGGGRSVVCSSQKRS